jgi:peptidoglycan hydrolase CwlO-like protein
MTNEEMQRAVEFILNQQAQFAADIQKLQESQQQLQESQQQLQESQQKLHESQQQLHESQLKLNESQAETNQLLSRLAAVTVKGFEDTNAKINALVDAQMRTDETVRDLTAVVDRYFRGRQNGG